MILVCDNTYQLLVGLALHRLGRFAWPVKTLVTLGSVGFDERARQFATNDGIDRFHISVPVSEWAQVDHLRRLLRTFPAQLAERLSGARSLAVFNDLHPYAALIRHFAPAARVTHVEEGVGTHRSRPLDVQTTNCLPYRILDRTELPELHLSERMGEAPWIDALLVSQTDTLTSVQARKKVETFDLADVMTEIRRNWGQRAVLPETDQRPVVLLVGQPFVEDGVLREGDIDAVLQDIAGELPEALADRAITAYKPHPRETAPEPRARRIFGSGARMLSPDIPLELVDFEERKVLVLGFNSGGLRSLGVSYRCISLSNCFDRLRQDIGSPTIYPGTVFLDDLNRLAGEIGAFLDPSR